MPIWYFFFYCSKWLFNCVTNPRHFIIFNNTSIHFCLFCYHKTLFDIWYTGHLTWRTFANHPFIKFYNLLFICVTLNVSHTCYKTDSSLYWSRKKFVRSNIRSITLYSSETWILWKLEWQYSGSLETWRWRKMEKIWSEKVTNEVLKVQKRRGRF